MYWFLKSSDINIDQIPGKWYNEPSSPHQLPALLQQTGRNRLGQPPFDTHLPGTIRLHI